MERQERTRIEYQGNKFPWWLILIWIVFSAWAVAYTLLYFIPDLRRALG